MEGKGTTTNGFYVGKELFREGSKNGKAWKMYKLKFKPSMDSDKFFTMTLFNEAKARGSITLAELKEGQQYRILYDEKEAVNNEGIPFISKTAFGFYNVVDAKKREVLQGKGQMQEAVKKLSEAVAKPDLANFNIFKERYLAMLKKSDLKPNAVHMVGSFIATYEKDRVKELIEKCKVTLKQ